MWATRSVSRFGDNRAMAENILAQARWQLTDMLLDAGDVPGASAEWSRIAPDDAKKLDQSIQIRLAAGTGTLDALLQELSNTR